MALVENTRCLCRSASQWPLDGDHAVVVVVIESDISALDWASAHRRARLKAVNGSATDELGERGQDPTGPRVVMRRSAAASLAALLHGVRNPLTLTSRRAMPATPPRSGISPRAA